MEKLEVIEILKEKRDEKRFLIEYYNNNFIRTWKVAYDSKLEAEDSVSYISNLIIFLTNEDNYESYTDSINKFHNQYLNQLQEKKSDLNEKEEEIKRKIEFYKKQIVTHSTKSSRVEKINLQLNQSYENILKHLEEELTQIKLSPSDFIEKQKQELEEKIPRLEKIKKDIIDMLNLKEIKKKNLSNIKDFLNKEINTNIENEELRKVTSLILTYIDYTKEEILKELKKS